MNDTNLCDDMLENIRFSLYHCTNNRQIYNFPESEHKFFAPLKCDNINSFIKGLHATKTQVLFATPILNTNKPYTVEYNVKDRLIMVDHHVTTIVPQISITNPLSGVTEE
jgi:hypothetical protein